MKIKKGDNIIVITGKDRGKKGKVTSVMPEAGKVIVEGVNVVIRNVRPRRQGEKGQRVEVTAPLSVSNVKLVCPKCGQPTRVGFKLVKTLARARDDSSARSEPRRIIKKRMCKRCKQIYD